MQSPLIALPVKESQDVELAKPLGELIRNVYEQRVDVFSDDLQRVNRTREGAIAKASSNETARDALFRWFHMLEMLELRFAELRAPFSWHDAFTGAEVTQQALAYEKASVLFNLAARISGTGLEHDRRDARGDGLKRSYAAFRQAAGLLDYIYSNFLHAPSEDMGGTMVQALRSLMLVQAAEIFLEKSIADAKGAALIAKLASHVANTYTSLAEEWQDTTKFASIPPTWRQVVLYKSKYASSVTQYYRARADDAAGLHGAALVRWTLAEKLAKEAARAVSNLHGFNYPSLVFTTTLPGDAAAAAAAEVKAHTAQCAEARRLAEKDNDLVYHELLPSEDALPPVDTANVATAIPIREIFSQSDVQGVLGPDVFPTLVPLSVHESASMYSEEQAKLIRAESERVQTADEELEAALASMNLPQALQAYAVLEGGAQSLTEPPPRLVSAADALAASGRPVEEIDRQLARLTQPQVAEEQLRDALSDLDEENRACERLRVEHGVRWTQEPIGSAARSLRRDLTSSRDALRDAQVHDQDLASLWASARDDVASMARGADALRAQWQSAARAARSDDAPSLLDLSDEGEGDTHRAEAAKLLQQTRSSLESLRRLPKERGEQLAELKTRVRSDDISRVLLLNRRMQNVEPKVFAAELAKFTPLQAQLVESAETQRTRLAELSRSLERLATHPGTEPIRKQRRAGDAACAQLVARWDRAYEAYTEVCAVLDKATSFYAEMNASAQRLGTATTQLLAERRSERQSLLQALSWDRQGGYARQDSGSIADDLRALNMDARPRQAPASGYASPHGYAPSPPGHGYTSPPPAGYTPPSSGYSAYAPPSGTDAWPAPPAPYSSNYATGTPTYGQRNAPGDRPAPPPRPPRV